MGMTIGAAGAVAGSSLLSPALARAAEEGGSSGPKPITYGFTPPGFSGTFRFSFLDPSSELGVITDFNGIVGAADVQGTGTASRPGTASKQLLFDSDMRFMKGTYVGEDGAVHRGTFAFV